MIIVEEIKFSEMKQSQENRYHIVWKQTEHEEIQLSLNPGPLFYTKRVIHD